ncbi:MAG: hypothetical protein ACD_26C00034G0093 [uncultured bacterium]|nr:MAG: hypothetical protein ACD_26C00034G0093 [uncultured bacterium]
MNFKQIFKEWKWTSLILIAILTVGFGIRIYQLTLLPVFVDEAIYVRWAQVMANEPTLRFLPLSDGKQPLFMWILMFVIKYFSDPLFIGRLVSVATGVGTMFGVFVFSYLLFKNKFLSLFSTFLYSISPFSVFFDRMALVDSMLSMFGVWTAIFAFLTAKYKRLDYALLAGFCLGFAALTKSPALFITLLLPTFWLMYDWKSIWRLGATYVLAFAMYNIQRLGPNFSQLTARTGDYILPISHAWTNFWDPLIPHLKDFLVWLVSMGPWPLIPLLLIGIFIGFRNHIKETLILLAWIIVPVFIQAELGKTFTARYIYFVLPYLFILVGMILLTQVKWLRVTGYGLIILFIIQSSIFNYYLVVNPLKANLPRGERSGYLEEWTAGQGIKEISEYLKIEETKNPGNQIVVGTEGFFGTLPDGLQIYVNKLPNIVVIGVGVVITDVPNSLKEAVEAGNKTYLVINKSRFNGNVEKQGYKLIAKYPKGLRLSDSKQYKLYGLQEELLFFELQK